MLALDGSSWYACRHQPSATCYQSDKCSIVTMSTHLLLSSCVNLPLILCRCCPVAPPCHPSSSTRVPSMAPWAPGQAHPVQRLRHPLPPHCSAGPCSAHQWRTRPPGHQQHPLQCSRQPHQLWWRRGGQRFRAAAAVSAQQRVQAQQQQQLPGQLQVGPPQLKGQHRMPAHSNGSHVAVGMRVCGQQGASHMWTPWQLQAEPD